MFIGVDHGTQAVRFATLDDRKFELPRKYIAESTVINDIEEGLNLKFEFVKLIGLSYSMGDGINKIMDLRKVTNRGLREGGGAGRYVGGRNLLFMTQFIIQGCQQCCSRDYTIDQMLISE